MLQVCACSYKHVFGLVKDSLLCSAVADYDPDSASVFFAAGQVPGAIQSFSFDVTDDSLVESLESFLFEGDVSAAAFAARFSNGLSTDTVTVNIVDNDGRSLLSSMHEQSAANVTAGNLTAHVWVVSITCIWL